MCICKKSIFKRIQLPLKNQLKEHKKPLTKKKLEKSCKADYILTEKGYTLHLLG